MHINSNRIASGPQPRTQSSVSLLSKLVFASSVIALLYLGTLFQYKIVINSDTLFAHELISDWLVNPASWFEWRVTPAPAFFPDLFLYTILQAVTDSVQTQIFLVSYAQWILLLVGISWLIYEIRPRWKLLQWQLVIGLLGAFTTVILASDYWVFFYTTNNHFAALIFPVIQIALLVRALINKHGNWVWAASAQFLLAWGAAASTSVYLLTFTVPATLVLSGFILARRETPNSLTLKVSASSLLSILMGSVAGLLTSKYLLQFNPSEGRTGISVDRIASSVRQTIGAIRHALAPSNVVVLAGVVFVLLAVAMLLFAAVNSLRITTYADSSKPSTKRFRLTGDWEASTFLISVMSLLSFGASIAGGIIGGGIVDVYGLRYLSTGIILLCIWAAVLLIDWLSGHNKTLIVIALATGFLLVLTSISAAVRAAPTVRTMSSMGISLSSNTPMAYADVSQCLDKLNESGIPLRQGVGDYWQSREIEFESTTGLQISAFLNDLTPFLWMSSSKDYLAKDLEFNWLLVRKDQPSVFELTKENMSPLVPHPDQVFECGENTEVWFWSSDDFNELIHQHIDLWKEQASYMQ